MKLIYIINLIAAALFSIQSIYAAPSEAEFRKYKESWTLTEDGSQEYRCYKELTIFTHTAMHSAYGETFIKYNPLYQELKIHDSYTIQKDGHIVKTPANAFVEVLPEDAAGMPAYNHLKEMVVVHTGLELGATIVLDYSIISKPGYLPEIDVCQKLQQTSPIKDYEMRFTFPKDKTPHYSLIALKEEPKIYEKEESTTVVWNFSGLEALSRDPRISLQNKDIPGLLFSTYKSNADALKSVFEQFDPVQNFIEPAAEITKNTHGQFGAFNAIYDYVLHDIELCPLSFKDAGFRIRPMKEVVKSAYATEMEKLNILCGLLKAAGISVHPAAAYYMDTDENNCGLNAVGKWLAIATNENHTFYLDAASDMPAGISADFMVENGIRENRPDINMKIKYKAEIDCSKESAESRINATFSNEYLPYRIIKVSDMLAMNDDATAEHNCYTTRYKGKGPVEMHRQGNFTFIKLPGSNVGLDSYHFEKYNSSRNENLMLPHLFSEEFNYSINIPEGMIFNTADIDKEIQNSVGSLSIKIIREGNMINVSRSISIDKRLITPEEFGDFRRLIIEWNDPHMRQIVLK